MAGAWPAAAPLSRRQAVALGAFCGIFGLLAWAFYLYAFRGDPGQDWMVFYTASGAYFDGNLPLIFDGRTLTAALNQRFSTWLGFTLNLHPWVYPPSFLLLFLPFGLLPPAVSLVVFLASGFIAVAVAAGIYVGRGQPRWIVAFSLVLCPAVPFNVMTGQNAFFTSALLVGGFGVLGRYPGLAGMLFGLLSFKPQLWLMVPVALVAARQWRVLAATAASALLLAVCSLVVFGPDIWHAWLALMNGTDATYRGWLINGRLNGLSVFACVSVLGASPRLANLAQALAVAIAAASVYWIYRQRGADTLQLAALLAATMLAAPHASASDAVLLALAVSLLLVAPRARTLHPSRLAFAAVLWIAPLFNPPSVLRSGALTPLLILLFLAIVVLEIRERAACSADAAARSQAAGAPLA